MDRGDERGLGLPGDVQGAGDDRDHRVERHGDGEDDEQATRVGAIPRAEVAILEQQLDDRGGERDQAACGADVDRQDEPHAASVVTGQGGDIAAGEGGGKRGEDHHGDRGGEEPDRQFDDTVSDVVIHQAGVAHVVSETARNEDVDLLHTRAERGR